MRNVIPLAIDVDGDVALATLLTWRWAYLTNSIPADEANKLEKAFDVDLGQLSGPRGFARRSGSSFSLLGPQDRRASSCRPRRRSSPS